MGISPLDLIEALDVMDPFELTYSHKTQRNTVTNPMSSNAQTSTFGGTRTFNFQGQPSDSDNDTDRGF
jgi:hypothetical protein